MTEREKGLKGKIYNPNYDDSLINLRMECQDKCFKYNNIIPSSIEKRTFLIQNIINSIGDNFLIEQPFRCDYGNIKIGNNFYSNYNLTILDGAFVYFGDNCFIGPNCSFYTAIHPIDYKLRNKGFEKAEEIHVGNNCWFGGNVTVLPGVKIGNNCVIGAGSVVTKDIEDNSVVCGNPCRIIRKIEEDVI